MNGHGMRHEHGRGTIREALPGEVVEEGWLEAMGLAAEGPILIERGIEQQLSVGQRLAVDPLEERNAAERERSLPGSWQSP